MFAVMMTISYLFVRLRSLSRPASLDLRLFPNPSEMQLFSGSSMDDCLCEP